MLSTEQMMEPRYIEYIKNWRKDNLEGTLEVDPEPHLIRTALVIELCFYNAIVVFIDLSSSTKQEIVLWEYQEIARYRDFYHYLLSVKEHLIKFITELEAET
jgi:hypothetical protein